jgi:AcrR family transcriptional regulator
MGRPRLHDHATESRLLAAAEELLASEGLAGFSVRRVSEAAGVSPRAIYSLFENMDGLLSALVTEAFQALYDRIRDLPLSEDPMADLVDAGAEGFRGWALARPNLFRLVFSAARLRASTVEPNPGVLAFGLLTARARRCAEAGLVDPANVEMLALTYHAACEGLAALELRGTFPLRPGDDGRIVWRRGLTALIKGYGPTR